MFNKTIYITTHRVNASSKNGNWKLTINTTKTVKGISSGGIYTFTGNLANLETVVNLSFEGFFMWCLTRQSNISTDKDNIKIIYPLTLALLKDMLKDLQAEARATQFSILELLQKIEKMPLDTIVYVGNHALKNIEFKNNKVILT